MVKIITTTFLILMANLLLALDVDYDFLKAENSLKKNAYLIINGGNDSQKMAAAFNLFENLQNTLEQKESFDYPFDSLKNSTVSILNSPNNKFRIFSFNAVLSKQVFKQFLIIQHKKKNKIFATFDTTTLREDIDEFDEYSLSEWNGCLYYKLQLVKKKGKKYYLLAGFNGGNGNGMSQKILEVLSFDKKGNPTFGAPLFKQNKEDYEPKYRDVYNYSNQVAFILRFETESKMIVMTHLSPNTLKNAGKPEYYLADGSYDYYTLRKGVWTKHIDLTKFDFKGNSSGNITPTLAYPDDSEEVKE